MDIRLFKINCMVCVRIVCESYVKKIHLCIITHHVLFRKVQADPMHARYVNYAIQSY